MLTNRMLCSLLFHRVLSVPSIEPTPNPRTAPAFLHDTDFCARCPKPPRIQTRTQPAFPSTPSEHTRALAAATALRGPTIQRGRPRVAYPQAPPAVGPPGFARLPTPMAAAAAAAMHGFQP